MDEAMASTAKLVSRDQASVELAASRRAGSQQRARHATVMAGEPLGRIITQADGPGPAGPASQLRTAMKRARSLTRPAVAPAQTQRGHFGPAASAASIIPPDADNLIVRLGERAVQLTNLRKPFWREPLITKGDLLRYYAAVAPVLLPHLRDRAMVMKRYPNGADGDSSS